MMSSPFLFDEDLLQQVAGGDPTAYDVLYQRYYARLGRFLASWLTDPRKTEDLRHEVLLEVWKSAGTYRGHGHARWPGHLQQRGRSLRLPAVACLSLSTAGVAE